MHPTRIPTPRPCTQPATPRLLTLPLSLTRHDLLCDASLLLNPPEHKLALYRLLHLLLTTYYLLLTPYYLLLTP